MPKNISIVISSMFEKNIMAFPSRILVNARIVKIKDLIQSATKLEYHACLVSTHNIETLKSRDRSSIVRIQYYQKPFKSIGMAMIIGLLI